MALIDPTSAPVMRGSGAPALEELVDFELGDGRGPDSRVHRSRRQGQLVIAVKDWGLKGLLDP
ncbi:MAG: hypothetical protein M1835_002383 [Candelina submexicana]|nr:MAG: hypothetical protein M1835_002383 [Candelina submexicana]